MRPLLVAVLVLAAGVAGCAAEQAAEYELGGTFTENATREQMDELRGEVEDRGGSFAELESYPVQFRAEDLDPDACEEVRSFAKEADYVREVGDCEQTSQS